MFLRLEKYRRHKNYRHRLRCKVQPERPNVVYAKTYTRNSPFFAFIIYWVVIDISICGHGLKFTRINL